ncbi:hypothetical protein Slin14017_G107160 [Septoria linicola]|nr:hypothetical protein Slin14017_G107160 [Septoria linicola]
MAYLMYAYAIGVPANGIQIENGHYSFVAPPEWVYLPAASASRRTLEVIHTVSGTHANNPLSTKLGITFSIGSRAYNILLGSPMLSNVASFLVDHKYRFGAAAVTSITFWNSYKRTADGTPIPDILIYVQSVDASLVAALKDNSAVDAAWTTCGAPLAEHRYAWKFSPRWQQL